MQGPPGSPHEAAMAGQCPQCASDNIHKPSFTWWGGAIGPRLFNHTVCRSCGFGFDGKTGETNRNKIIAYTVVLGVVALVVFFVFRSS